MFLSARKWGWSPSEFWDATMSEWFLEFEMQRGPIEGDHAGGLTNGEVERLSALLDED
jgi:hypothetical protein